MTPVQKAHEVFQQYAAMSGPELPQNRWSALQVQLCRWQVRHFGVQGVERNALGVAEELGELGEELIDLMDLMMGFFKAVVATGKLSHAALKSVQKIRGFQNREELREKAGDAIGDIGVFLIQASTAIRLDFGALVFHTAQDEVLLRDWTKNKEDGNV